MWNTIISGLVGFGIGWLVFKRPDFMTNAINWLKANLHLGSG